ncbi:MAG: DUF7230 family protein, partial [Pseudomonadales bacterium]
MLLKLPPTKEIVMKQQSKSQPSVTRNLVAKHAPSFHRAQTHLNKKAALKRGKMKHKKG